MRIYAGIGSRRTPENILEMMAIGARQLKEDGWLLRSGHADGADLAFEAGAAPNAEIHLPWSRYNDHTHYRGVNYVVPGYSVETELIAAAHHPAWDRLSDAVRKLMCRNVTILLGQDLLSHAEMVICWTPDARYEGGTAQGMRVADTYNIPIFNLDEPTAIERLTEFVWPSQTTKNS